jgi:hypothetical protein
MGTQTGEQRVTVMGAAVSASGVRLEGIGVTVLDDEGMPIGTTETNSAGEYQVQVTGTGGLTVQFTTPTGQTASAAVDVANKTSVTVNLVVPQNGQPIVVVPVPTPTPSPTAGTSFSTPTPPPSQPTGTPVPPPSGQTPTPVPTSTPPPVPTAPIYTPPPDDGGVCEIDSQVDSDGEPPVVCCTDQQVAEEGCCNDYFRAKGLC